ncbi:MAG: RsmD family RNA methyltransferase [Planctomycetota bacterium]|nr:RsmD family RNA methyltransferase [Planctomycetota bacterium]
MRLNTQMRIISGTAKGSQIMCVPGDAVRPTPERMRGAVFNILGADVVGANVLDLFSGTGSLGLESLSRGAAHCVFVEMGFGPLQALRKNISGLGFDDHADVMPRNVFDIPTHLVETGRNFDLVFAAPPYPMIEELGTAKELFNIFGEVLEKFGTSHVTLNLQHSPRSHIPEKTDRLQRVDHRQYGNAEFSQFALS